MLQIKGRIKGLETSCLKTMSLGGLSEMLYYKIVLGFEMTHMSISLRKLQSIKITTKNTLINLAKVVIMKHIIT